MSYGVESSSLPDKRFKPLKVLYNNMPSTSGCEKCEEINTQNAFWCCRTLNPSMFYYEFLYIWRQVK